MRGTSSPPNRGRRRAGPAPDIQLVRGARGGSPEGDAGPLHTRLYRALRAHILEGELKPGARIPSARALAADLRLSRNTVETAIAQLVAEGFVERRVGSGTVVARSLSEAAPFRPGARKAVEARSGTGRSGATEALSARARLILEIGRPAARVDPLIGAGVSDAGFFPWQQWTRLTARFARRAGRRSMRPASPAGLPELREQIAAYVNLSRGLRVTAEQVVIVSSTQQAVDLCARVLLDPGDLAFVEEPGYPSARAAFALSGARVRPVPVDAEGALIADLPTRLRRPHALYLTPSQQFPLGGTMSLARRLQALAWAADTRGFLIEDDCDREFWYDGRPLAALHGLDRHERVIYLGTFNKALFPGLRLAYLIVPPRLAEAFAAARRLSDGFSPVLPQIVLADFMAGGHFAGCLRQARAHYRSCRDALVRAVSEHWGPGVVLGPATAGLHVAARMAHSVDDLAVAAACAPLSRALGVSALSAHATLKHPGRGLLLNFGAADPAGVRESIRAMAPVVRGAAGAR